MPAVLCKFWQRGHCKNGDRCNFEHPGQGNQFYSQNRFGVFQSPGSNASNSPGTGAFGGSPTTRDYPYHLSKDIITNDLSKERPLWILSAYGPGREAPLQLFGGHPREQSFEELRLRYYELAASGNQQQAIQEAQALVNSAEQQIQTALNDVDGAIKYIINGANEHPNRLDICKAKGENLGKPTALSGIQQQASPFAQASTFGQPSSSTAPKANTSTAFGLPSTLTGPTPAFVQPSAPTSTFGQPSAFSQQPSTFGQPSSMFGQPSSFGQPSRLGQPTTGFGQSSSAFGQPSTTAPAFGQPTAPSSAFTQPAGFGTAQIKPSVFGTPAAHPAAPTNPFGPPTAPSGFQSNTFGQPSQPPQPSPFAQAPAPPAANPFGQPTSAPPPNPFALPTTTSSAPSFTQPAASSNPFAQAPASSTNGIFSAPTNTPAPPTTAPPISNSAPHAQHDAQGLLRSWNNKPITYIDNEPCYKRPDGSWEKVWFPNGAPVYNKTPELPLEMYDEGTKENYMYLREKGTFLGGRMPDLPPRREWCRWDF